MKVSSNQGDFECVTQTKLKEVLKHSSDDTYDDIWISGDSDYPCLAVLIHLDYACVHYFLNDQGDMWQSIGDCDEDIEFISNGETSLMPGDAVIPLDKAIQCADEFYEKRCRPECIKWREL